MSNEAQQDVFAFLEAGRMAELEDYLRRGRLFQNADTGALKERWVELFKIWTVDFDDGMRSESNDIQAELKLRGAEPPDEAVRSEMEAFAKRVADHAARMSADELAQANTELVENMIRLLGKDDPTRN